MTLPSDQVLVGLCADIYGSAGTWDHFDDGVDDDICWALKRYPGYDVIVFRGSKTAHDWLDDFRVVSGGNPLPMDTGIGHVHAGFYDGLDKILTEAEPLIQQPVIVTGHSLGAARADLFAAILMLAGHSVVARVVFGEPKPGLPDFAQGLSAVPGRSYRNGNSEHHDLVTDVPLTLPPYQFVHPTPVVVVTAVPTGDLFSRLGMFAWHHIELYQAALKEIVI